MRRKYNVLYEAGVVALATSRANGHECYYQCELSDRHDEFSKCGIALEYYASRVLDPNRE